MRILSIVLLIVLIGSCKKSGHKSAVSEDHTSSAVVSQAAFVHFKRVSVPDSRTGLDAFTCLVPESWQTTSWSKWVATDFIEPFRYTLVAVDTADTVNRIEIFPTLAFFTSTGQTVATRVQPNGLLDLIASPQVANSAVDAIEDFLIPAFRPGIRDLRVRESVPLNSLDGTDADGKPHSKETGVVRIQYDLNGRMVEEIFFATLSKHFFSTDKYNTQCRWHIESAISCRAHDGFLDEQLKNLQTMAGNMRYGYAWLLRYDYAARIINNHRKDTLSQKELSDALAERPTDAEIGSGLFQTYQRRLSRRAWVYNRYQPLLQDYVDNSGEFVQLPKGYTVAWKSNDNRYLLTDSTTYKPSENDLSWYELKPNKSRQESEVYYTKGLENEELDIELNKPQPGR